VTDILFTSESGRHFTTPGAGKCEELGSFISLIFDVWSTPPKKSILIVGRIVTVLSAVRL
jgi:hypothetical protein